MARQGDEEAATQLAGLPLPFEAAHLWNYYADPATGISVTRTSGMGPCRLTRAEIRQWEQDEFVRLERWERRAIMAIDALHLRILSETNKGG